MWCAPTFMRRSREKKLRLIEADALVELAEQVIYPINVGGGVKRVPTRALIGK